MSAFGEEVKSLLEKRGLTQKSLAQACGVQASFISKLVLGERDRLGADVLFRLATALGVPTDHFRPFLAPDASSAEEQPTQTAPPARKKGGGKAKK